MCNKLRECGCLERIRYWRVRIWMWIILFLEYERFFKLFKVVLRIGSVLFRESIGFSVWVW